MAKHYQYGMLVNSTQNGQVLMAMGSDAFIAT